jgi:hypothetical protein
MNHVIILSIVMILTWTGCSWDPPPSGRDTPANSVPVAQAGDDDRTVLFDQANNVTLSGLESWDPDGDELHYTWAMLGSGIELDENMSHAPSITVDLSAGGDFTFMLFVDDGKATSIPDTVTIHVETPAARVDDDFYGDPDNGRFTGVQSAIDAVGPGDLVVIYPGTYNEHVEVAEGIRLLGLTGSSGQQPEITATVEAEADTHAVLHLNSGTTLENLAISCSGSPDDGDYDCAIINVRADSDDVTLKNCLIELPEGGEVLAVDGISIETNAGIILSDNTRIKNISSEGIFGQEGSRLVMNNSRIERTWGSAVFMLAGDSSTILKDSVFYHSGYHGIHSESPSVSIDHCTVAYFYKDGIYINNDPEPAITNTLVHTTQSYVDSQKNEGDEAEFNAYGGTIDLLTMDADTGNLPNRDIETISSPLFDSNDHESGILELSAQSPALGAATDETDVGARGDILNP